jgi:glycogen synthase
VTERGGQADMAEMTTTRSQAGKLRGVRVLHALDHSLPEHSGYAFRSHAILCELVAQGADVSVITSLKQGPTATDAEEIDGILYRRTAPASQASTTGIVGQIRTIHRTRKAIADLLAARPPQFIHAHSPCLNGLAAMQQRVPLLYEMRSLWEDSAVTMGTTREGSVRYRVSRALETFVVRRADECVVICDGLRRELVQRGVAEEKITVVPNALPSSMFELPLADEVAAVRKRLNLGGEKLIGFFGTFFEWEGLEALVEALPDVVSVVPDAKLLLAGGGRQEAALRELVEKMKLKDRVIFAGRVGHADIRALYGAASVMAYPRVSHRLTDVVTPLKPLESMAQRIPVVASAVGGHRELIVDRQTGFLYPPGDGRALARTLVDALTASAKVREVVENARKTVEKERRWSVVAERYQPAYERLSRQSRSRQ